MADADDLLTVNAVAAFLQVTPQWVHACIARSQLPAVVVDRMRHVRPGRLERLD